LGVRPRACLVFLQVGGEVHIFEEET
jgi:hypothetical protein